MDNGADALFPVTLLVGVGLLGGSLGLALRRSHLTNHILGAEPDPDARAAAQEIDAVDEAVPDAQHIVPRADLVVLCAPPLRNVGMLEGILRLTKPGALVTDVGGTKAQIAQAAGAAPQFVGGHPMAGSEQGGVRHARADLFDGATWAVCPTPFSSAEATEKAQMLARGLGAHPLLLNAETHDAMAAVTSHLPHVLAAALMAQAGAARNQFPDLPRLAAGGLRDGTRVAGSSPALWRDVCLSNRVALRDALQGFRIRLETLEAALDASDADAIEAFFQEGQAARRGWYGP